jgi:hypothetical protein
MRLYGLLALIVIGCGKEKKPAPPPPGPYDTCEQPADCAWGEIAQEITATKECMCLFGCAGIPLSRKTVERRKAQHAALCTPGKEGSGLACPVDDCAPPGAITCLNHKCVAAPPDAGR